VNCIVGENRREVKFMGSFPPIKELQGSGEVGVDVLGKRGWLKWGVGKKDGKENDYATLEQEKSNGGSSWGENARRIWPRRPEAWAFA